MLVTIPEVPMVATAVLPLSHVPPVVLLASVIGEPMQVAVAPVMVAGSGLTFTTVVRLQPVPSE